MHFCTVVSVYTHNDNNSEASIAEGCIYWLDKINTKLVEHDIMCIAAITIDYGMRFTIIQCGMSILILSVAQHAPYSCRLPFVRIGVF